MLRREQVIGIVSSWDIRWRDSEGYSLLVTDSRLVGGTMPATAEDFRAFFAPGKGRDAGLGQEADKKAAEILLLKDFEIYRDKVLKIVYEAPSMLLGGRLLLATTGKRFQVDITVVSGWNPGILSTLNHLISTFLVFAPEAFYDERTGARMRDEVALRS